MSPTPAVIKKPSPIWERVFKDISFVIRGYFGVFDFWELCSCRSSQLIQKIRFVSAKSPSPGPRSVCGVPHS
jgi:hypothetical protein